MKEEQGIEVVCRIKRINRIEHEGDFICISAFLIVNGVACKGWEATAQNEEEAIVEAKRALRLAVTTYLEKLHQQLDFFDFSHAIDGVTLDVKEPIGE